MGGLRARALLLPLALLTACADGCSGCNETTAYPEPPPAGGELSSGAIELRLQQGAVDFYATHFVDLLAAALPHRDVAGVDRLVFALPELSLAGDTVVLRDGCVGEPDPEPCPPAALSPASVIEITTDALRASAAGRLLIGAGGRQRAEISFTDLPIYLDAAVALDPGSGAWVACHLRDETESTAALRLTELRFEVTIEVDVNEHLLTTPGPAELTLAVFDAAALDRLAIDACDEAGRCDDPICASGDCNGECVAGLNLFTPDALSDQLLVPALEATLAPGLQAHASTSLIGVADRALTVAGALPAASLLPINGAATVPDAGLIWAGSAPDLEPLVLSGPSGWRGVSLALAGGTTSTALDCVPAIAVPDLTLDQGPPPFFDGVVQVTDPRTGGTRTETYHAVAMLSESFARQLGLTLYHSGALCMRLGPEALTALTAGTLDPTLATLIAEEPLLAGLGPPTAPFFVELHPTELPALSFGSGALVGFVDGMPVFDSDLAVDLGDLGLSIYVTVDGAAYRVATVAADAELGLDLVSAPGAKVELAVDRIVVDDPIMVYTEIPGLDLAELGALLVEVTLGNLVAGLGPIDLDLAPAASAMLGDQPIETRINTVVRDGFADVGYQLAYLTLCDATDLVDPAAVPCYVPPATGLAPRPPRLAGVGRGWARLAVAAEREHQNRVDGGPWSRFYAAGDGLLTIRRRVLRLGGEHQLDIRSRRAGEPRSRGGPVEVVAAVD